MVYPNQKIKARKAILVALQDSVEKPEQGLGYNLLFEKVKEEIGSRATFSKYLDELQHESYVSKTDDPRHKKGVVIYRLESSIFELQTIEFIEKLEAILEKRNLKSLRIDPSLEPLKPGSKQNVQTVANCITLAHMTLFKMVGKIQAQYGSSPYVRAVENAKVVLDFKENTTK